ncbi:MAG: hypothetical protein FD134_2881, partial [Gallionellaceae bacterium]
RFSIPQSTVGDTLTQIPRVAIFMTELIEDI